jgi:hypothetical protein
MWRIGVLVSSAEEDLDMQARNAFYLALSGKSLSWNS